MTNKKLLEKLKEDMEMRGFSHYTKDSYYRKTKEIINYFEKTNETSNNQRIKGIFNETLKRRKESE